MSTSSTVLPGHIIGSTDDHHVGSGTHIQGTTLAASIGGPLQLVPTNTKAAQKPTATVARSNVTLLPEVGTVVLGRVTRTNPRQANISILALGSSGAHVCHDAFPALVRQQDIRATEIDKVKVTESFRVGDIVRAVVISLGDEKNYYLSTAKNEFGVVMATSEWGNQMVPISWKEFQDQDTGIKELRKVAKLV